MNEENTQNAPDNGVLNNDLLGDWRPIETAPKDGTRVLLWNGDFHIAHWDDVSMECRKGWQISCVATDWNYYEECSNPTFWMPLTFPPNDKVKS